MKKFTAFAMAALLAAFMAAPAWAYTDVTANTEFGTAINTVSEKNIMTGYEDGTFQPQGNITRAEFAKVAVLAAQEKLGDVPMTLQYVVFDDVKEDGWYVEHIEKAVNMGLMKGDAEGTFRPNDTVSEAEVYTVMLRMLGYNLDNDSKKWPYNYLELADSLDMPTDNLKATGPATRGVVAEIVTWALNQPLAGDEVSSETALDTYAVVTAVGTDRITVATADGKVKNLRDSGSNGKVTAGQLVRVTANKAGYLQSIGTDEVKTNNLYDAAIANGKIELNNKTYTFTKDAVVLLMNSAGGVSVVDVDKLLDSSYAAGLRSSKYTVPIQYVLSGNAVSFLLISDYAGQSELHFGFIENVGMNADGTVVQFWGDTNDYQWNAAKDADEEPEEDGFYAYVLRGDGVRGYKVAVADEEIIYKEVTSASQGLYKAGDKQFIVVEDTVIWKVEFNADGSIRSCELGDEVDEGDKVRVRYKVDSKDSDIEAAYVIIDETDK